MKVTCKIKEKRAIGNSIFPILNNIILKSFHYPVIVHFLLVAINLSADVNAVAPQFPVISIVAEVVVVLSIKLVRISTKASFESWQFCNPTEFLKIFNYILSTAEITNLYNKTM